MTQSLPPKSLVLYADDDPDDLELLQEAFNDFTQAIELITFDNGLDLLEYVQKLTPFHPAPCLFILDINMPRLNGKETLKKLRTMNRYEDVPAVLFSTSTLPADAAFAGKYNAGFVTKPLHSRQIHKIVDQIINHCADDIRQRINKLRS